MHHNNPYFWQFVMCEILNFVIVLVVFSFTDIFLAGQFWSYGWRMYDNYVYHSKPLKNGARPLPMCSLFPTVTS